MHIHAKVHLDRRTVLTSQLFFADDFTDEVYAREPYSGNPARDTSNDSDGIYRKDLELSLRTDGDKVLGFITFDVSRA